MTLFTYLFWLQKLEFLNYRLRMKLAFFSLPTNVLSCLLVSFGNCSPSHSGTVLVNEGMCALTPSSGLFVLACTKGCRGLGEVVVESRSNQPGRGGF